MDVMASSDALINSPLSSTVDISKDDGTTLTTEVLQVLSEPSKKRKGVSSLVSGSSFRSSSHGGDAHLPADVRAQTSNGKPNASTGSRSSSRRRRTNMAMQARVC